MLVFLGCTFNVTINFLASNRRNPDSLLRYCSETGFELVLEIFVPSFVVLTHSLLQLDTHIDLTLYRGTDVHVPQVNEGLNWILSEFDLRFYELPLSKYHSIFLQLTSNKTLFGRYPIISQIAFA